MRREKDVGNSVVPALLPTSAGIRDETGEPQKSDSIFDFIFRSNIIEGLRIMNFKLFF